MSKAFTVSHWSTADIADWLRRHRHDGKDAPEAWAELMEELLRRLMALEAAKQIGEVPRDA